MAKYVSPEKYRQMNPGIGIETIKKMLRTGKLKGYIDEDPETKFTHYHILVEENEQFQYSREYVENLLAENAALKEKIRTINSISII